jgi:hypothetical protein
MDLNEVFDFLVEDVIYDRILEHSMDSHVNDLFKKDNTYIVDVCKTQTCKEENCQICLESINKEEEIYDLPCKHTFHSTCLDQSISFQHYYCPSCRQKIPIRKKNNHIIVYNEI